MHQSSTVSTDHVIMIEVQRFCGPRCLMNLQSLLPLLLFQNCYMYHFSVLEAKKVFGGPTHGRCQQLYGSVFHRILRPHIDRNKISLTNIGSNGKFGSKIHNGGCVAGAWKSMRQ